MMVQLRFAPRFSADIAAGQKVQSFRLGATRGQAGDPVELVESGSGRLLRKSWVLGVQTVSILRARDEDGRPQIRAIQVDGAELSGRGCWAFACREGFRDNEPGCRSADEAMARFFATIYPAADPAADIEPLTGHVTIWADLQHDARSLAEIIAGRMDAA